MKKYTTTDTTQADAMTADYIAGLSAVQIALKYNIDCDKALTNFLYRESKKKLGTSRKANKKGRYICPLCEVEISKDSGPCYKEIETK